MTVEELIEELKKLPKDLPVYRETDAEPSIIEYVNWVPKRSLRGFKDKEIVLLSTF